MTPRQERAREIFGDSTSLYLLLTATTMVAAVVRKLVSEEPDQDRARRSLRP